MAEEETFDLAAADLRADADDLTTSIEVLAAKLEATLPAATRVHRRARRLFSKEKRVERIDVALGDSQYGLRVADGRVEGWRERTVRGISIKREPLELAGWIEALSSELRERAGDSADARQALERLLG